ncbi:MAG: hypothetical protein BGO65_11845 [Afipia sp. 64-13]|nr:MAG: hypothetical protein BGO65_11845 [Afipia sp. 64-13]
MSAPDVLTSRDAIGRTRAEDGSDAMTETYDPQRSQDRPTEDDIAQAELGGVKGSPKLPPAPLTKQEAEQMLPNDEPGHVA